MTGAVMPDHSDTVIMQEQVERDGDTVFIAPGQKSGQHVRHAGEDLTAGSVALLGGQRLFPAEIGMVASLGISELGSCGPGRWSKSLFVSSNKGLLSY